MKKYDITNGYYSVYGTLTAIVVILAACLSLPVVLPLGESFWDTYIYIDGAHRLSLGQEIYRDFHAPVGPLNYILFGLLSAAFPDANVVLVIQWSLMLLTLPVVAVICHHALERGAIAAFGLLLPYLMVSILPFNIMSWNAFPGVDGFAYYNRHSAVLLYLLVATLFFVRGRAALIGLVSVLLLTLAFTKINGFAVAGLMLAFAAVSRRIGIATSAIIAALCLSVAAVLEVLTGSVSAYLGSVLRLLANNDAVLVANLFTTVSARFDVIFAASLFAAYLLASRFWGAGNLLVAFDHDHPRKPRPNRLDQDWLWLGVMIVADILFESQNFGGAAFVSVWPFLLVLLLATAPERRTRLSPLVVLIALVVLPTITKMLHSTARAVATSVRDVSIATRNLPESMRFSAKALTVDAARKARPILVGGRETYQAYADANILPAYWLYFDHRFQVTVLETMDEAIGALRDREARLGRHYEVIDVRDFANPITAVMGRTPARGVSIGGDPFRAVLPLTDEEAQALSQTDIVLLPTCPVTTARKKLLADYARAYEGFEQIELTDCFDALEHPRYATQ
ncbi:hypothetical protein SAMN05877838_3637 [Hoeflea halophila]|uniref:4-amino-4-deoxy-L-arabinose transferase-like glycosyltransferase n=1 Tax=Hoeflea halophila TaxID=714899 RepID=A0A286IF66_9HYPH|nr:hypothetical protein [Hoeflea halophila]SOE18701.1 hypothetical protein SAMN05877838_3637 [Hoeflea halophila]